MRNSCRPILVYGAFAASGEVLLVAWVVRRCWPVGQLHGRPTSTDGDLGRDLESGGEDQNRTVGDGLSRHPG